MSEYLSGAKIMAFVSDLDKFLQKLDKRFPQKSASQQKVIKQYQRIIELRDKKSNGAKHSRHNFIEH
jgi:hypothetical protein